MNNNYLDQLEKTNLQVLNSGTKKRNKNTTKSYNNNMNFDTSEVNNYVNNMNYSANIGQMTNKSMIVDSTNYNSNHASIVKNYDNSFTNGALSSSKATKRPQSS